VCVLFSKKKWQRNGGGGVRGVHPWSLVYTTTVSWVAAIASSLSSNRPMLASIAAAARK
jgi:hypothetical protein